MMIKTTLSCLFVLLISLGTVTASVNENVSLLHEDIQVMMDAGEPGIVYKATISAVKVWMSLDGEHKMFFTLTDGSKWFTATESDFKTALRGNWTIGDPVTIKGTDPVHVWEAHNHTRNTTINLYYNEEK